VQRLYNPEGITQYNIVPGLMGVILTMTMVMMTGLAMTRERERGTMENLLATPVQPLEVISGKIVPYIFIGLIRRRSSCWPRTSCSVPFLGSRGRVPGGAAVHRRQPDRGHHAVVTGGNQLQAVQLTFFYFLPNILLSGFMFPFAGMPTWAQWIGNVLPMTYFNRMIRSIMLKGSGWIELWPNVWPVAAVHGDRDDHCRALLQAHARLKGDRHARDPTLIDVRRRDARWPAARSARFPHARCAGRRALHIGPAA
jgi:ABC-2 type transport system permease protein